jgi:hypothetical protein
MFKNLFPAGTTFELDDQQGDFRGSIASVGGFGTFSIVSHGASGVTTVAPVTNCLENVGYITIATISFFLSCDPGSNQYYLRVVAEVYVELGTFINEVCRGRWEWVSERTFPLSTTCIVAPQRHCDTSYTSPYGFLDTPVEVTASGITTSLGDYSPEYTTTNTFPGLNFSGDAASIGESIREAMTATFRITSRPSCQPVPADCDVPLADNRIITFGTATERDFILGTPKFTTTGPQANDLIWNYEHYGGAGGTTTDPWVFNAKLIRDADNRIIEEHNLELFCALDDSVSPAVSRWYVREFTYCTPEAGQQTTGQWIGVVESYESTNACNEIAVGDPVPIGFPAYEAVDGYPVVDFGVPCDPPAPIGLEITDYCP